MGGASVTSPRESPGTVAIGLLTRNSCHLLRGTVGGDRLQTPSCWRRWRCGCSPRNQTWHARAGGALAGRVVRPTPPQASLLGGTCWGLGRGKEGGGTRSRMEEAGSQALGVTAGTWLWC
jgi:hypothetical protein